MSTDEVEGTQKHIQPTDRLRRAEAVLAQRTSRFCLVLEQCMDSHNHQAVLRTAEALGIQHVWTVRPLDEQLKADEIRMKKRKIAKKITKGCSKWLTMREFESISACISGLREHGYSIWATDLSPEAEELRSVVKGDEPMAIPPKLAIVIGRESDGVSQEMLREADKRIFLPMYGFTESFNLSVATALVLSRLFDHCPEARGDVSASERQDIRRQWYSELATSPQLQTLHAHWLNEMEKDESAIDRLPDLRRPKSIIDQHIPPKILKRDGILQQAAERAGMTVEQFKQQIKLERQGAAQKAKDTREEMQRQLAAFGADSQTGAEREQKRQKTIPQDESSSAVHAAND